MNNPTDFIIYNGIINQYRWKISYYSYWRDHPDFIQIGVFYNNLGFYTKLEELFLGPNGRKKESVFVQGFGFQQAMTETWPERMNLNINTSELPSVDHFITEGHRFLNEEAFDSILLLDDFRTFCKTILNPFFEYFQPEFQRTQLKWDLIIETLKSKSVLLDR